MSQNMLSIIRTFGKVLMLTHFLKVLMSHHVLYCRELEFHVPPQAFRREKKLPQGSSARRRDDATTKKTTENFRKKRSVAQIKDQIVRMKTHTESSKSELSSGTFDPVKVVLR